MIMFKTINEDRLGSDPSLPPKVKKLTRECPIALFGDSGDDIEEACYRVVAEMDEEMARWIMIHLCAMERRRMVNLFVPRAYKVMSPESLMPFRIDKLVEVFTDKPNEVRRNVCFQVKQRCGQYALVELPTNMGVKLADPLRDDWNVLVDGDYWRAAKERPWTRLRARGDHFVLRQLSSYQLAADFFMYGCHVLIPARPPAVPEEKPRFTRQMALDAMDSSDDDEPPELAADVLKLLTRKGLIRLEPQGDSGAQEGVLKIDAKNETALTEVNLPSATRTAPAAKKNDPDVEDTWTIEKTFNRWAKVESFTWLASNVNGVNLVKQVGPYGMMLKVANVRNIIPNYRYVSATTRVRVQLNSTKFHLGRLIVAAQPMGNTGSMYNETILQQYALTTIPHAIIDASNQNSAELEVPWQHFYRIGDREGYPGRNRCDCFCLWVTVLNQLIAPASASQQLVGTVFVSFADVQLEGIGVTAQTLEAQGFITGWLDTAIEASRKATRIFSRAQELGTELNLDKPLGDTGPMPLQPRTCSALSHGVGVDFSSRLNLDQRVTSHLDRTTGMSGRETALASIWERWGLLTQLTWQSSQAPDTVLFEQFVNPFALGPVFIGAGAAVPTPLQLVTDSFALWRGTIEVRVDVVCTSFHTGRLIVAYVPSTLFSVAGPLLTNAYHAVFDIGETKTLTFEIPFVSPTPFKSVTTTDDGGSRALIPPYANVTGRFSIAVVNSLVVPATLAGIAPINVYVRGGSDFEVALPIRPALQVRIATALEAQGDDVSGGVNIVTTAKAKRSRVQFGEEFVHLNDLLRRKQVLAYVAPQSLTGIFTNASVISLPVCPLAVPTYNTTVRPVPGTDGNNFTKFAQCFAFWSGSLRYLYQVSRVAVLTTRTYSTDPDLVVKHDPSAVYPRIVPFRRYLGSTEEASFLQSMEINPTVEVDVPYYAKSQKLFNYVPPLGAQFFYPGSNNGTLSLYSDHPLTPVAPDTSISQVTIFIGAGDDFQFSTWRGIPPMTWNASATSRGMLGDGTRPAEEDGGIIEAEGEFEQLEAQMFEFKRADKIVEAADRAATSMSEISANVEQVAQALVEAIQPITAVKKQVSETIMTQLPLYCSTVTTVVSNMLHVLVTPSWAHVGIAVGAVLMEAGILSYSDVIKIPELFVGSKAEVASQEVHVEGVTPVEAQGFKQLDSKVIAAGLAMLCMGGIAATFGRAPDKQLLERRLQTALEAQVTAVGFMSRHVQSMIVLFKTLIQTFDDFFREWFGESKEAQIERMQQSCEDVANWMQEVYDMDTVMVRDSLARDFRYHQDVLDLVRRGEVFLKETIKGDKQLHNIAARAQTKARELKEIVDKNSTAGGSRKVEPFVVFLYGPSQIGKSYLAARLGAQMWEKVRPEQYERLTFTRNVGDAYWSGYAGQPIVIYDDFGQNNEDNTEVSELFGIVSPAAYQLNMADLGSKGKVFTSHIVIACTNIAKMVKGCHDLDALNGRRKNFVQVRLRPELEKRTASELRPEQMQGFGHLQMRYLDPLDPNQVLSDWMEFGAFSDDIEKRWMTHHRKQRDELLANPGEFPVVNREGCGLRVRAQGDCTHTQNAEDYDWRMSDEGLYNWVQRGADGAFGEEETPFECECGYLDSNLVNAWLQKRGIVPYRIVDVGDQRTRDYPPFAYYDSKLKIRTRNKGVGFYVERLEALGKEARQSGWFRAHEKWRSWVKPVVAVVGAVAAGLAVAYFFTSSPVKKLEELGDSLEGQNMVSGDYQTRHAPRIQRTTVPRPIKLSAQAYMTIPEGLLRKFIRNMVKVTTAKNGSYGLAVSGGNVLVPRHIASLWLGMSDDQRLVTVTVGDVGFEPFVCPKTSIKLFDDHDLAILTIPESYPRFADLTKHLPTRRDLELNTTLPCELIRIETETLIRSYAVQATRHDRPVLLPSYETGELVERRYPHTWHYGLTTYKGWCGSLLVSQKSSMDGVLLGFHVGGHQGGAHACVFMREEIEAMLSPSQVMEELPDYIEAEAGQLCPSGQVISVGSVDYDYQTRLATRSDIIPSPIHGEVYVVHTEPSALHQKDPRIEGGKSPLKEGLKKYSKRMPSLDPGILKEAVRAVTELHVGRTMPAFGAYRELSEHEVINGIAGEEGFDRMNMTSSEGWPWVLERPKGDKSKSWMFGGEAEDRFVLNEQLRSRLDERERMYESGVVPLTVYCDNLKDERRKPEKVRDAQTRVFSGAPVDHTMMVRKYFLHPAASIQRSRIKNGIAIGINADSTEWTDLVQHLEQHSMFLGADFKGWDGDVHAEVFAGAFEVLCEWSRRNGASASTVAKMKVIAQESICHYHIVKDAVYLAVHGTPSGHPLTAVLNSLAQQVLMCCAWRSITGRPVVEFWTECRLVVYGDDQIVSISGDAGEEINFFTLQRFFSRNGIGYQSPSKNGDEREFWPLEELTFLKRGFRREAGFPFWLAPLDRSSLEDELNWIRIGNDAVEALQQNYDQFLRGLQAYGRAAFEEGRDKVQSVARRKRIGLLANGFDEIRAAMFPQ